MLFSNTNRIIVAINSNLIYDEIVRTNEKKIEIFFFKNKYLKTRHTILNMGGVTAKHLGSSGLALAIGIGG